ncbi:hypothetical protein HDU84_007711 [Entophlyctis sp. JEL0112]|nr:hypothetical protein HDU84_007711 [Entophlyctis sp. JEL0112]
MPPPAATPAPAAPNPAAGGPNWSGLTRLALRSHVWQPASTRELADELKRRPPASKVKVIGSGLSFEAICALDDLDGANEPPLMVDLAQFKHAEVGDGWARFGAGVTVDEAIRVLTDHGRMLACSPGVIGIQTLAGAAATGTHGQGLKQASLADTITALTVVHADGSIRQLSRSDDDLHGYITALGMLGIITEITIETQPLRLFHCLKQTVSLDEFRSTWVSLNDKHEFCKAWWYPETDLVHIWTIDEGDDSRAHIDVASVDTTLNPTIDMLSRKMAHQTSDSEKSGRQFETIERFRNTRQASGMHLHDLVCKGIPVPQINCEIAIPLDRFDDSIRALQAWLRVYSADSLHYPFIFRCTGQSKAWLSPASRGPVCYIGFLVYLSDSGSWYPGSMELMRTLQKTLSAVDGVPHLGKHFSIEEWPLSQRLPRWRDFMELRQRVDPHNRFLNEFLGNILKVQEKTHVSTNRKTVQSAGSVLAAKL